MVVMIPLILIFAGVHSGLASLRDDSEKLIGERTFRVLFAGTSLPLAVSIVVSSQSSSYDCHMAGETRAKTVAKGTNLVICEFSKSCWQPNVGCCFTQCSTGQGDGALVEAQTFNFSCQMR